MTSSRSTKEPIAIIGIGCRLPGNSDSPEAFWKLLMSGTDAIREIPADRWNIKTFYDPKPGTPGKSITKWGAFIEGINQFDAEFFSISPREADWMDPQQRLLLEASTRALEDAGQDINALRGSATGVFVGISTIDYMLLNAGASDKVNADIYSATGQTISIAANRISYVFDLRGPSVAMDTACSSALTALHFACQSLWRGDCKMAITAGVNAIISPAPYLTFSRMGMLSPTGRCQAFDSRANGFVRGEGSGAVLLKPLSAAQADGDRIYAVIRATGANQDGRTNGITVPNPLAQQQLVLETLLNAGLKASVINYVEAHGTGTPVGDPLEAHALGTALGQARPSGKPLLIGSVKTNIGHLEAAAGIAGLIKLALVLKNRVVPANLHFRKPNPNIDLVNLNLRVSAQKEKLPERGSIFGAVNSFGFGGANAHAILESAPELPSAKTVKTLKPGRKSDTGPLVLCLSARSTAALKLTVQDHRALLKKPGTDALMICRSAALRRTAHSNRLVLFGRDRAHLIKLLGLFLADKSTPEIITGTADLSAANPVFVCSGQGPQWWGMGRELMKTNSVFRAKIEECNKLFREFGDWSLVRELARDEKTSRMDNTAIAQPAIFAIQVALAAVWEALGVKPAAVVGHSVGEVAAGYITGVFTLREAARIIFYRGECMSHAGDAGRMLAVGMPAADAEAIAARYPGRVIVGAYNGPASLTLSGDADALEEIALDLEKRGIFNRFLQVKYAFHSHHMDPVRKELAGCLGTVKVSRAKIPLYSTVTGMQTDGLDFGAGYWWKNVRQPVRFADAADVLVKEGHRVFLELSAHPALVGSLNECLKKNEVGGTAIPSLRRQEPEESQLLMALGALHCAGARVDWRRHFPESAEWITLPPHPFIKEHYWEEPQNTMEMRAGTTKHPLFSRRLNGSTPTWCTVLDFEHLRWLPEHRVGGHIVFPGSGYVEAAVQAGISSYGADVPLRLEDVAFEKALFLPDGKEALEFQTMFTPDDQRITFSSRGEQQGSTWALNAKARLSAAPYDTPPPDLDIQAIKKRCPQEYTGAHIYDNQNPKGLVYGPYFQGIEKLWRRDGEAICHLKMPKLLRRDFPNYFFHPAFLDASFQMNPFSMHVRAENFERIYLPVSIERLRVFARPGREFWTHVTCVKQEMLAIVYDFQICDEKGRVLVDCQGFRTQATSAVPTHSPDSGHDWLYELAWRRKALEGFKPLHDAAAFLPARFELPAAAAPGAASLSAAEVGELSAGLTAYAGSQEDALWQRLLARFPGAHPELFALRLAKQDKPLTPNLREQLDQDSVSRGGVNRLIGDALASFVSQTPPDRVVSILECNGGAGGLTAYVVPRLDPLRTRYVFADSDKAALQAAEKKFFSYDFVSFKRMDLAKRAGAQRYEIVISHHTTPEMAARLRRLVAPGGLLVLVGHHNPPAWVRAVFERPDGNGATLKSQLTALREAGFEKITRLKLPEVENLSALDLIAARVAGAPAPLLPAALSKAEKPSSWLFIADEGGLAQKVAAHLEERGDEVIVSNNGHTKAAFGQILVDSRRRSRFRFGGVVFFPALDHTATESIDTALLQRAENEVCHGALHLVQSITERGTMGVPPLWFITRGAQSVLPGEMPACAPSALVGLVRTMGSELMGIRCSLVDLTPGGAPGESQCLAHEITTEGNETEIAWRGTTRLVNRLVRSSIEEQPPARTVPQENAAHRLEIINAGVIDQLTFHRFARRAPEAGQVEIEIRAAALNFRDVMKSLGIYPSENELDMLVGDECSGVITRVGRGVKRFKVGDEVIASGLGLFASHTTLPEQTVIPKPKNVSFAGAVTIPVTFMTAWYALHTLGRMRKGDRVLIQAGTGGVGLAAIQLAKLAGAEIFATAGNEEKRDFLRALGVKHVFDSRSVSFADDVRNVTEGCGVDLVLNSLAGPAIMKGIACLAPHGRFLEIGKRDIYADSPVGLRPFRNNLSMHVIDMGQVMLDQDGAVQELLGPVLDLFRAGKLHPLPYRAIPAARAVNAFRIMSAARHIGKIVITMDGEPVRARAPMRSEFGRYNEKASYMIVGGLGGFGLSLAEMMAGQGMRQIVLTGRSGASTAEAKKGVRRIQALGTEVVVLKMDVTSEKSVRQAFAYIKKHCAPLRGVMHAAAVLDDATLPQLTAERFSRVMAPKVTGSWHLHRATEKLPLEFFVLFSSISSLVGAAGQGNYAAANSFMDALAHYRRARGLTALSVNWGAIAGAGLAVRDKKVAEHLKASGVTGIAPDLASYMLSTLLQTAAPQIGFMRVDWQVRAAITGDKGIPARLSEVVMTMAASASGGAEARDAVMVASVGERPALVVHYLREIVARVLRTSPAKLEVERPLKEMGLDSLMAFELLHRIKQGFGISLPPNKLASGGTIAKLAEVVFELVAAGGDEGSAAGASTDATVVTIESNAASGAASALADDDGPHPDCLLPMRPEGTLAPLFIFHGAGGTISNFNDLIRVLPAALPVFGLQSRSLVDPRGERPSLAAMARDYAALIHAKQPEGSIRLAGYSAGGLFAIATAGELEKLGRKVTFIGLLDTAVQLLDPEYPRLEILRDHLTGMYRYLVLDLALADPMPEDQVGLIMQGIAENALNAPSSKRIQTILDWLSGKAAFPFEKYDSMARNYLGAFSTHWDFLSDIRLEPVNAPIHQWIGVSPGQPPPPVPAQLRALTPAPVRTSALHGNHYEIMQQPAVATLARQMARALARA